MLFSKSLSGSVGRIALRGKVSPCQSFRALSSANSGRVGFIGLGNMGYSMAQNIITKQTSSSNPAVMVFDLDKTKAVELANSSPAAQQASSIKELAENCDVIITMLPATKHVEGVMHGEDGIFANAKEGALLIDSSTIDPIASKELHTTAAKHGLRMLDAPVSGGVTGAAAGSLTFMVGGKDADVNAGRTVLEYMGKTIVHCGPMGAGGITKLCNNLSLAVSMVGTCEAMALGVRMGMDPKQLAGVLNTSTARCWSSEMYNPVPGVVEGVPSSRGYEGGFGVALMEKDLGLAVDLAQKIRGRVPLGAHAHQLYGLLSDHGYASKDFSVAFEYLSKLPK